jgi:hypothetical protein
MVKKIILAIAIAVSGIGAYAQKVEEVTLTVSGDGTTKSEATEVALRSAIEQAFGVFVSANTTILDDELVKDEIATVSSGNIKSYKEIADVQLPNGNTSVTIQAIVSVSKLITYAQSKGNSAEFAGATFGMNMKLKELNTANEEKAIANMISQLKALVPAMFDYKLEIGEPVIHKEERDYWGSAEDSNAGNYDIPVKIYVIFNQNTETANTILLNTLSALSLPNNEMDEYKKVGLKCQGARIGNIYNAGGGCGSPVIYNFNKSPQWNSGYGISIDKKGIQCYLRSENSIKQLQHLNDIFFQSVYDFKIVANTGENSYIDGNYADHRQEGLIAKFNYPNNDFYKVLAGNEWKESANKIITDEMKINPNNKIGTHLPSWAYGNRDCSGNVAANVDIIVPHLVGNMLNKYKGDLVPYFFRLIFTFPKEDISKYNNFTISHK